MCTISCSESTNVLRNFVKVGVSSIAYLRNLFAEGVFEDTAIGGLQLKRLTRVIPESAALLDWIEYGVFDAMDREYLKHLVVSIHNSQNVTLESYTFTLNYGNLHAVENTDGASSECSVHISVSNGSDGCPAPPLPPAPVPERPGSADKEDVKRQTVRMLRDLVLLAQSLSPLPENRYLSMRLLYYDDRVPRDYEPQFFRDAPTCDEFPAEALNVDQQVGELETGHHNLAVDVRSCCYVDENVTNCKTSVRAFDTLTRRTPAMSALKPSGPPSVRSSALRSQADPADPRLPPGSGRPNGAHVSTTKPFTANRNIILGLLKRGHELSLKSRFISKDSLATGLGIDCTLSKALLKKMMEYGYIDSRFVKGKGYLSRCYEAPGPVPKPEGRPQEA